jgi:uncharacterized RDD family membrane protein YckC
MTCSYCGSRNGIEDSRCRRCGRRPTDVLNVGALATNPEYTPEYEQEHASPAVRPVVRSANMSRPVQRTLFQDNVIPFESYAPAAPPKPKAHSTRTGTRSGARRSRVSENQTSLDFLPPAPPAPRQLGTTVEAVIVCEAPVATPLHRAVAAAIDWVMCTIAYGLFLGAYFACGGEFTANKLNFMVFGAALLLIGAVYGLTYTIAGGETVGMRCAHLKLVTFDGFKPDTRQRVLRFAGSCLSLCTVLGLLWSIWDEESLAWQDHISRTFPSPREVETLTFHRR